MCGIAGILGPSGPDRDLLARMGQAIVHRGPDDGGIWTDADTGIGFSHRRLSIVDLSPQGHQPMASADGRWVICFNGEIYNHPDIRLRIERDGLCADGGWRGHSDTETLVEAVAAYGVQQAIAMSVGMFAVALWDRKDRTLHLVRDRYGEKPLYVGRVGKDLMFASELKAFRQHPQFQPEISRSAVSALASFTAIPAPMSIHDGISKLMPGSILSIDRSFEPSHFPTVLRPGAVGTGMRYQAYWSFRAEAEKGAASRISSRAEAEDQVEAALARAVAAQSVADVPIGAFLSGGIDSSLVAAMYQRASSRPINTFTIGFAEAAFDEAPHAAAIARHLGANHHELTVTPSDARDIIPSLPDIYDEPFADSSQIPTYIVSRFARQSVTVALTGDGGDELFAGYNRHVLGGRFWTSASKFPSWLRRAGASGLALLPPAVWSAGRGGREGRNDFGRKMRKGLRLAANARTLGDVYASFVDEWYGQASPVLGGEAWRAATPPMSDQVSAAEQMACWDAMSYLPDDILVKVDRAAMAVSLETRVPFLDHRLAGVAARVSDSLKIDQRGGKAILRNLLARHLPIDLFERPKTGFGVPVGDWLRGPLRDWAETMLNSKRLASDGWFDADRVRSRWDDHLAGRRDATAALWTILMFNAWLDRQ